MPLSVARPLSRAAVEAALSTEGRELILVAQRDQSVDAPEESQLFSIATRGVIKQMGRPSEDLFELIVVGIERVVIVRIDQTEPYLRARFRPFPVPDESSAEIEALHRAILELAAKAI